MSVLSILAAACLVVASAVLAGNVAVALYLPHEFTQVESIVALHSMMFASGRGLYRALNSYPFTVSPYGPIYYTLCAGLQSLKLPPLFAGRLISATALSVEMWLAWRILTLLVASRFARLAGLTLVVSTWNVVTWGTIGQTDTLACCFSLAAFWQFLVWRERRTPVSLVASGALVVLAIFTKQTALASAAAIGLCLLLENRRQAGQWIASAATAIFLTVLVLNTLTHGHYFEDAVLSNINPLRIFKFARHVKFFLASSAGIAAVAVAGLRHVSHRTRPLFLYLAFSACIWLATCAKVGSEANYQIEVDLLLALGAACALDAFAGTERERVLLVPLALNFTLSVFLSITSMLDRVHTEPLKAVRDTRLAAHLQGSGPVISSEFGALLNTRQRIDVEPLIYALLVRAGRVDATPVLHDLQARRFSTVVLYQNVFASAADWQDEETLSLTDAQIEALRKNYRLAAHVPGPYLDGDYVYEPRRD